MKGTDSKSERSLRVAWALLVAWNLPVPLFFCWSVTDPRARLGMFLAISLFYYLGDRIFRMLPAIPKCIVWGGISVALAQFWPGLQLIAGAIAMTIGELFGLATEFRTTGMLGGCVITLLTGAILLTAAAIIGLSFQALIFVGSMMPGWKPSHTFPKRNLSHDELP